MPSTQGTILSGLFMLCLLVMVITEGWYPYKRRHKLSPHRKALKTMKRNYAKGRRK